jgi:Holliday junction resolvase
MGKKAKGFEGGDSLMMANPSGRKGAAFEIGVLKWLRSRNVIAERMRLVGKKDEGDIVAIIAGKTYVLELKNRKAISLPAFWDEAVEEAKNFATARGLEQIPPAFVIVKRRNASIERAFVIQDLESWLGERQ